VLIADASMHGTWRVTHLIGSVYARVTRARCVHHKGGRLRYQSLHSRQQAIPACQGVSAKLTVWAPRAPPPHRYSSVYNIWFRLLPLH
jgi:hypothetical protein